MGYDDQKGSHGSHKRGRVDKLLCDCSTHLAFFLHEACSTKKTVGKALFASTLACVYEHDLFRTGEGGNGSPYAVAPGKPCPNRCVHECEGTFVRNGPFFEQVEAVFEGQVRCFKLATKTFPAPFPDPGMKVPPGKG